MKFFALLALTAGIATASIPLQVTDENLAAKVDHVFLARVVGVEMIDAKGKTIEDPKAMTGPGTGNTIRLAVEIDEVYQTTSPKPPETLKVPLDPMMHYRLGQVKEVHSGKPKPFLLLLTGPKFSPAFEGVFSRPVERKEYFVSQAKKRANQGATIPK